MNTNQANPVKYKRPLLKISGEMLGGTSGKGFDGETIERFATEVRTLVNIGVIPAIVIGGGNFFRGARSNLPLLKRRHRADAIGMLATTMNAICFAEHLESIGVKTRVYSAIPMGSLCRPYQIGESIQSLNDGIVCLFSGGTGNPYFSTDSASALRAIENGCDVLIKGTKVNGVYDTDPAKNKNAVKFDNVTFKEVLDRKLGVMDLVAITLCRDNNMPLKVLSLVESGNLIGACRGEAIGTNVIES